MCSHPSSRRATTANRIKKIKISIPLPSRPADYKPGSGPSLRRPALLPPSDSTAYIDDRILLPPAGLAADGRPLPKRMKYIVGWRDLPAARLLVSAMDILEYVSPHELEEWEYKMELELDEERARVQAERQALEAPSMVLSGDGVAVPVKRKPGRPPLHTKIEAAAVVAVENEAKDGEHGRLRGGAMSLSTPKKRKIADFLGGYSSDESPSEQLQFELAHSESQPLETLRLTKEEDDEPTSMQSIPRAQIAPMASLGSMTPVAPMIIEDDSRYLSVKSQYSKKPRPATKIVLPLISGAITRNKPERSESPGMPFPPAASQSRGLVKASAFGKTQASRPVTEYPSAMQRKSSTPSNSNSTPQPAPRANSDVPPERRMKDNGEKKKMTTLAAYLGRSKTSSQPPPAVRSIVAENKPQSQPPAALPSHVAQQKISSKSPATAIITSHVAKKKLQPPPVFRSPVAQKKPQPPAVYRSHVAQKKKPTTSSSSRASSATKAKQPLLEFSDSSSDEDDEPAWAVKRLEDMELYDVEGQGLVRYFKVRWEGDWPPEQNPTWEPEENIPDDLVREFCLTFKPKPKGAPEWRRARDDALREENELPTLRVEKRDGNGEGPSRPSSAVSGMFVYSSDDAMKNHVWDAPNSQGQRPNLNGVFPAPME